MLTDMILGMLHSAVVAAILKSDGVGAYLDACETLDWITHERFNLNS